MNYNKDCRADLGAYIQASTDKVVTNDNTPRTHGNIALGPSRNRQGLLKCFDLETGKLVFHKISKQIPLPDRMFKIACEWGRKSKQLVMKDSIQFLNRKGKKFDWDNDELSDLEVKKYPIKIIYPDITAELPRIKLERDLNTLSRVTVCSKPSVTKQAADASISAGLDAPREDSAVTRGVDDAPATDGGDNADQGVVSDEDGNDDLPRLATEDDNSDSNEDDGNKEDGTPADTLNEDSVGNEETPVSSPVQKTSSGRVPRKPNIIIPTMTGKSHGNSRDQGVNFPLVGKYHPDNDRDCIDCQYAGDGYKT